MFLFLFFSPVATQQAMAGVRSPYALHEVEQLKDATHKGRILYV